MLPYGNMTMQERETSVVRLKNSTIEDIEFIRKQNKVFETPAAVVDFAIKKLIEKGVPK